MYLLPTDEDIARLYCLIDPETRFLLAAQEAINELTKDAMPYFDDIEDDIVNMRRDINGKRAPWYLVDHEKGQLRYKGSSFEVVYEKPDFLNDPIVQHASSWDEI